MTTGDGLAMIAGALVIVGWGWAAAWSSVRHAAIRRLGEGAWQTKTTTTRRRPA